MLSGKKLPPTFFTKETELALKNYIFENIIEKNDDRENIEFKFDYCKDDYFNDGYGYVTTIAIENKPYKNLLNIYLHTYKMSTISLNISRESNKIHYKAIYKILDKKLLIRKIVYYDNYTTLTLIAWFLSFIYLLTFFAKGRENFIVQLSLFVFLFITSKFSLFNKIVPNTSFDILHNNILKEKFGSAIFIIILISYLILSFSNYNIFMILEYLNSGK
ncbi:hypothetical protein [Mesohalobacter halotolerans]|uniref:Uncharacterized protein n=1 Tax=Mesohalobacter halotolerans TaxID=1883405 RepID=A0A4U5TVZ7_9FLAO|nr:hypothetical protein [Mesohalobacter halotolerans]TKS57408.1 hypothetical protein FCN74_03015 [Mesohalobacter halotolerans]